MVLDRIGIEIHAFHRGPCSAVVVGGERIIQQKFGPSLRSVNFDRHHSRRPDQDSILALLCDYKGPLLDSEAAAKFGRQHHCAAPTDFAGHCSHLRQNSRQSECRANGSLLRDANIASQPVREPPKELSLCDNRTGCAVPVVRRSLTILLVFLFAMQLGPACGFATVVTPDSMNFCQTKCPLESSQHHSGCCQVSATSDKAVAQVGIAASASPLSASVGSIVPALSPANGLRLLTYRSPTPPPQTALDLLCSRQL
jgi:hypothetical protein